METRKEIHGKADGSARVSGRRLRSPLVLAAALMALALLIPAGAFGHAGEVHTDDPAPSTKASVAPDRAGKGDSDRKDAPDTRAGADREPSEDTGASAASSETPPPPQVPESNPTVHFIALGAIAILGAGLLFLRRRRNAFG